MNVIKKKFLLLFILILPLLGCGGIRKDDAQPTSNTIEATSHDPELDAEVVQAVYGSDHCHLQDGAAYKSGLINEKQQILEELTTLSRYDIKITIPQDYTTLTGNQTVIYTNNEHDKLEEIYFRLFPNANGGEMQVSNVKVEDQSVEIFYEFDNTAVRIPLPTPLNPHACVEIEMVFNIKIPRVMRGNYGLFGYFDRILILDAFYPLIPVIDDDRWSVDHPPSNGDLTYLDMSYYRVQVTSPRDLVIVASGNPVNTVLNQDKKVVTYKAGPSRDFYIAASEEFISFSKYVGETKVTSYAKQEFASSAEFALQVAIDAITSYIQRFGYYPYTEYDIVSTPMKALGIEYPGIVGIGLSMYKRNTVANDPASMALFESIVAHETGHQWFYNMVGNDQVNEPWLDEAITQYITAMYFLDTHGQTAAEDYQRSWFDRWDRVDRKEIPIGLPSSQYTQNEYGAIVYGRGPIFLMTLAEQIGQQTMDESLNQYYRTHEWGIGSSESFKQVLEDQCQCDLTDLFDQWVYTQ